MAVCLIFDSPVNVAWPNGLTLDIPEQRVYWVDGKLKLIASIGYDGKKYQKVLRDWANLRHPFSVAVFEVISSP